MIECGAARTEHIPGLFEVRVSVVENALDEARLSELGITPASVEAGMLEGRRKGWVVEQDGRVVGFSMADGPTRSVWALFVRPEHQSRGFGQWLLAEAVAWLWTQEGDRIWLETAPGTRAAWLYQALGWREAGTMPGGDLRFELERPNRSENAPPEAGGGHAD